MLQVTTFTAIISHGKSFIHLPYHQRDQSKCIFKWTCVKMSVSKLPCVKTVCYLWWHVFKCMLLQYNVFENGCLWSYELPHVILTKFWFVFSFMQEKSICMEVILWMYLIYAGTFFVWGTVRSFCHPLRFNATWREK